MSSERFWILLSRKLSSEATEKELEELRKMLEGDRELREKAEYFDLIWRDKNDGQGYDEVKILNNIRTKLRFVGTAKRDIKPAFKDTHRSARSPHKTEQSHFSYYLKITAVIIVALLIGLLFGKEQETIHSILQSQAEKTVRCEVGKKMRITLADGSTIWLNADSELRYPDNFDDATREVTLKGEGYFDIVHDPGRPFIIHVNQTQIKVLGTTFNVRAYSNDEVIETSVVTGKVMFVSATNGNTVTDPVYLAKDQKAIYSKITGDIIKKDVDSKLDIAWKDNKLVFRSNRFDEVGKVLERTYGKKVKFANERLKNCRLTGVFENKTLQEVLFLLSKTNDYKYDITEDYVMISGAGCKN